MSSWFSIDPGDFLVHDDDSKKKLYRIIPFDSLLSMLNDGENNLVKTSKWDDVYENFFLKESFHIDGVRKDFSPVINRFFGQCWSSRNSSDALWRIYSPDRKSVRIRTTIGKLDSIVDSIVDPNLTFLLGKVKYYSRKKIENDMKEATPLTLVQVLDYTLKSLFVKRDSFKHESEYRLVCMCNPHSSYFHDGIIKLKIEPLEFIEQICFDPRADDSYVARCKKVLTKAFSIPSSRIVKSSLYDFSHISLDVIK